MKRWLSLLCTVGMFSRAMAVDHSSAPSFGIHVVDEKTGRGIPLVELRMVHGASWVTDNAGWIAFQEPGLMDQDVCWLVSGPGIALAKDGFGYACLRARTTPGTTATLRVQVTTIATIVGRLTGQGLYRDSALLGLATPLPNGSDIGVVGQDSVQAVPFQGKIFWLWGDTSLARYPLGNFHTTSAWTARDIDPEKCITYDYFTAPDKPQQLRKMMPMTKPGAVWMFGLLAMADAQGRERLFSGYSRQQGLVPADEKGVAEYQTETGQFHQFAARDKNEAWRMPMGHAVRTKTKAGDHWYFTAPFAQIRVNATVEALQDANDYEMLRFDPTTATWVWQGNKPPTTAAEEKMMLENGLMKPEQARYQIKDRATGKLIQLHRSSIQWNAWRKRFVMIAVQAGDGSDPSALGEVWYAESEAIDGPWTTAVKVATHPAYSFYNPIHHEFFDREGGKIIYFEGTYTKEFSGQTQATPRYDYNQLLYRLDLSDPRLRF